MEKQFKICRVMEPSVYLPYIDAGETDSDFLSALEGNGDEVYALSAGEETVGLACVCGGGRAFLYLYIFPRYRNMGYGRRAAASLEQRLYASSLNRITTCYHTDNHIAAGLAKSCGYTKEFSSAYMIYTGPRFEEEAVPVRQYQDADYQAAQALEAEAFHVMRLGTGCFPDSVPTAPSEEMRREWEETSGERFVCVLEDEIVACAHVEGAELDSISVKLTHQGKGIGKRFLKYIVNGLLDAGHKEISLYCVVGNNARYLYEQVGFQEVFRNDYAVKKFKK